ncbi:type II toxin-antitoxin system RelE/ParE family toxin [Pseudonocardia sp. HH130630-07]|uniref:type II toxin-antitoxin system RelE/ParE family toxin n=1 Tax=Pseudonocardia sp. HH130630-07 TaxID=1690815 RepID=UPI0008153EA8|nr:type II toxin-antitoxin system RelE/ParE family toxin [Pseudonocardia sp. HH130630-07]ANY09857.1 hypothetical protein AFB00_06850 [Pseudonocardia sp. HH130630-07]
MLRSFADKATEQIWRREHVRRLHPDVARTALRKLAILDAAATLDDADSPPGNRLELLKGDRAGQHSIRVNEQYRICFRWTAGGPEDVELTKHYE